MALKLFTENEHISCDLLELYWEKDKTEFIQIVRRLWQKDKFKNEFLKFYFETLLPEDNPSLYKEIALYLTDRYREETYYKVLRPFLSDEDRNTLIENMHGIINFMYNFYILRAIIRWH